MKFKKKHFFISIIFIFSFTFLIYNSLVNIDQLTNNYKLITEKSEDFFEIKKILLKNEGDVYSYSAFTYDKFYPSELGIYKRNIFKLTGIRQYDIQTVVNTSLKYLNSNSKNSFELKHFLIGFMRSTPLTGYEYKLFFKNGNEQVSIKMSREIKDVEILEKKLINKEIINFVLPVSNDLKSLKMLKKFLVLFEQVSIKQDNSLSSLTIVLGGKYPLLNTNFELLIKNFIKKTNFDKIKFIYHQIDSFSRAKLLNIGIRSCCANGSHDLVFVCDLDIVFNLNFLNFCRDNTIKNKQVFFPILYSFYNPSMMFNQSQIEEYNIKNFTIDKNNGYFRDSGFGMACFYKQDFDQIGGFNDWKLSEWGGEDLFLYRKFFKSSNIEVFRSITPGLFHLYHSKECDKSKLDKIQYKDCVTAKILNEASHKSFGLFYFNLTDQIK